MFLSVFAFKKVCSCQKIFQSNAAQFFRSEILFLSCGYTDGLLFTQLPAGIPGGLAEFGFRHLFIWYHIRQPDVKGANAANRRS